MKYQQTFGERGAIRLSVQGCDAKDLFVGFCIFRGEKSSSGISQQVPVMHSCWLVR